MIDVGKWLVNQRTQHYEKHFLLLNSYTCFLHNLQDFTSTIQKSLYNKPKYIITWLIHPRDFEWKTWYIQAPFCGNVSNAETVFSNLILCRGAPLCLIAQAVFSSSGQRAFSMENTWLFNLLAFFIASNKTSQPFQSKNRGNTKMKKIKIKVKIVIWKKDQGGDPGGGEGSWMMECKRTRFRNNKIWGISNVHDTVMAILFNLIRGLGELETNKQQRTFILENLKKS